MIGDSPTVVEWSVQVRRGAKRKKRTHIATTIEQYREKIAAPDSTKMKVDRRGALGII